MYADDLPWDINVFCFLIQPLFQVELWLTELFRGQMLDKCWAFFMVDHITAISVELSCQNNESHLKVSPVSRQMQSSWDHSVHMLLNLINVTNQSTI